MSVHLYSDAHEGSFMTLPNRFNVYRSLLGRQIGIFLFSSTVPEFDRPGTLSRLLSTNPRNAPKRKVGISELL